MFRPSLPSFSLFSSPLGQNSAASAGNSLVSAGSSAFSALPSAASSASHFTPASARPPVAPYFGGPMMLGMSFLGRFDAWQARRAEKRVSRELESLFSLSDYRGKGKIKDYGPAFTDLAKSLQDNGDAELLLALFRRSDFLPHHEKLGIIWDKKLKLAAPYVKVLAEKAQEGSDTKRAATLILDALNNDKSHLTDRIPFTFFPADRATGVETNALDSSQLISFGEGFSVSILVTRPTALYESQDASQDTLEVYVHKGEDEEAMRLGELYNYSYNGHDFYLRFLSTTNGGYELTGAVN